MHMDRRSAENSHPDHGEHSGHKQIDDDTVPDFVSPCQFSQKESRDRRPGQIAGPVSDLHVGQAGPCAVPQVHGIRKQIAHKERVHHLSHGLHPEIQDKLSGSKGKDKQDEEGKHVHIEAGKPFIFTAEVVLKPEVELGKYKGIEVEAKDTTVTDEEVDAELAKVQEQNSRLVAADDKEVENGDQVTIDFEGFVDGVAFEGGKGENYPLTIGSGSFIPGFEEQLVGAEKEKEVEVNVTFPEEYHAEELAGKPAVFKCTVHEIKRTSGIR